LSTPHLCFFVRDETVRRQADEMLRTEHNALQNASDGIVVIDMQARIEYANPATARIWGYPSSADLVGLPLGKLLLNEEDGQQIVSSLTGEHYMTSGIAVARRYDGDPFRVNIRAACNRDSDGNVVGAVLSFSDLTERDRVQTAERDATRFRDTLKRLDDFRNVLRCGIGEVSALINDFSAAKIAADDNVKKRIVSAVDACVGLNAVLADVEDLIAEAMDEKHLDAALTADE
jgi:PAS domain S-box-containing protein